MKNKKSKIFIIASIGIVIICALILIGIKVKNNRFNNKFKSKFEILKEYCSEYKSNDTNNAENIVIISISNIENRAIVKKAKRKYN